MNYFPIALPFLLFLIFIFTALIVLVEVEVLVYAYHKIGINPRHIFALLLLSLLGSYVNIPVYHLPPEAVRSGGSVSFFWRSLCNPCGHRMAGNGDCH